MQYCIESAVQWLYPDSPLTNRTQVGTLISAAGGSVSFQVLLKGLTPGEILSVAMAGANLPFTVFRAVPVQVTHNTGTKGFTIEDKGLDWETAKTYSTRKAPFWVFDALEPMPAEGLAVEDETQALLLNIATPLGTRPGIYPITFTIAYGSETIDLPAEVEVTHAAIPQETLKITNWFVLKQMALAHGLEPYSPAHWDMVREYGLAMRRAHQNVFWITWDNLIITKDETGQPAFDFSHIEKLISMYLDLGFTTIEGGPLLGRVNWDSNQFLISTPEGRIDALSPEGYEVLASLLKAWADFLKQHNWYDKLIQHVGDEPHSGCADTYRIVSGIMRKFLPGVPLVEAVELYGLNGAVDIWVPKNNYYEANAAAFEAHRTKGDEIWFYTCCIPGGRFANRLLDAPLIRPRMLHWGNYHYNLTGFLHWGLNYWKSGQDPYLETCPNHGGPNHMLPPGDTHCVYPSKDGKHVCFSMRLEAMRGGAEDYELLKLLAQKDKAKADALATRCFIAFDDCDASPETYEAVRAELLRAF